MLPSTLAALGQTLNRPVAHNKLIKGIAVDSRCVTDGDLFVALKAERDGYDFIDSAKAQGAIAVLTTREHPSLPCLLVENTERALTDLARAFRDDFKGQVFALTGSQGKTSTRGFLASVLHLNDKHKDHSTTLVTEGNLNNQLGLPLTMCKLRSHHRSAVLELGASAVGDIDHLASIAKPNIAALLNARTAHIAGFGSIDRVICGKGEIIDHTERNGCVILNRDEAAFDQWCKRANGRQITTFGRKNADICWRPLTDQLVEFSVDQKTIEVSLPTFGEHLMENAAAACAMALVAGIPLDDVSQGLSSAVIEPGRMTPINVPGQLIIDDAYNASPQAVRSAIDWLAQKDGKTCLIMGGLGELGNQTEREMYGLGEYAQKCGITKLIGIEAARSICAGFGASAEYFNTFEDLNSCLNELITSMNTVLVKGSRSSRMERVVNAIKQRHGVK